MLGGWSENQFANPGMQPVSADQQIELSPLAAFEFDKYTVVALENALATIAKKRFNLALDETENRRRQITTPETYEIPNGYPPEQIHAKAADPVPQPVYDPDLPYAVACPL